MSIVFEISNITANKATGKLIWSEKNLESIAVSGPFGNGFIEAGTYHAQRNFLLDKPGENAYCDKKNNCWFQLLTPQFSTTRTEIGIHPDGNVPGTKGCIGIIDDNTKKWYDALFNVKRGESTEVIVAIPSIVRANLSLNMWKYYFNCNGPVVIEAGNINEAKQLCTLEYGCDPCEYLGCDPAGLCDAPTSWKPTEEFLQKAKKRKDKPEGDIKY